MPSFGSSIPKLFYGLLTVTCGARICCSKLTKKAPVSFSRLLFASLFFAMDPRGFPSAFGPPQMSHAQSTIPNANGHSSQGMHAQQTQGVGVGGNDHAMNMFYAQQAMQFAANNPHNARAQEQARAWAQFVSPVAKGPPPSAPHSQLPAFGLSQGQAPAPPSGSGSASTPANH